MDRVVGQKSGNSFALDPRSLVGRGSEGSVFRAGTACVKVFRTRPTDAEAEKLDVLCLLRRKVPGLAWPTELVVDPASGEAVGFAMELVSGESLDSLLQARETAALPLIAKLRVALAVAVAVHVAHEQRGPRIALGDVLKAGNLVIDGDRCALVDAGSVSLYGFRTRGGSVRDSVSAVTTPGYVPREVLDHPGALPSHAADLFALAVLLFELLLGRPPYDPKPCAESMGLDPNDAVRRGLFPRWVSDPPFEAPNYDPVDLPDEVDQIFRATLIGSAMRPPAAEWCRALEDWLAPLEERERLKEQRQRRHRRLRRLRRLRSSAIVLERIALLVIIVWLTTYAARWGWSRYAEFVNPPLPTVPSRPVGPDMFKEVFR